MKARPLDILAGIAIGLGCFGGVKDPNTAWFALAFIGGVIIISTTIAVWND